MKGIILCSLFLIVAICCSYGAPVETQPSAKKSARAVGASISTRVHIKPTSTKSYIDTHPHPKKRHLKRHHRLQYRRPRHKLIYPLKARLQYYGGEHIPLMPSAKAKHEEANIEMTNGEVFEHGGVPDLRTFFPTMRNARRSLRNGIDAESITFEITDNEIANPEPMKNKSTEGYNYKNRTIAFVKHRNDKHDNFLPNKSYTGTSKPSYTGTGIISADYDAEGAMNRDYANVKDITKDLYNSSMLYNSSHTGDYLSDKDQFISLGDDNDTMNIVSYLISVDNDTAAKQGNKVLQNSSNTHNVQVNKTQSSHRREHNDSISKVQNMVKCTPAFSKECGANRTSDKLQIIGFDDTDVHHYNRSLEEPKKNLNKSKNSISSRNVNNRTKSSQLSEIQDDKVKGSNHTASVDKQVFRGDPNHETLTEAYKLIDYLTDRIHFLDTAKFEQDNGNRAIIKVNAMDNHHLGLLNQSSTHVLSSKATSGADKHNVSHLANTSSNNHIDNNERLHNNKYISSSNLLGNDTRAGQHRLTPFHKGNGETSNNVKNLTHKDLVDSITSDKLPVHNNDDISSANLLAYGTDRDGHFKVVKTVHEDDDDVPHNITVLAHKGSTDEKVNVDSKVGKVANNITNFTTEVHKGNQEKLRDNETVLTNKSFVGVDSLHQSNKEKVKSLNNSNNEVTHFAKEGNHENISHTAKVFNESSSNSNKSDESLLDTSVKFMGSIAKQGHNNNYTTGEGTAVRCVGLHAENKYLGGSGAISATIRTAIGELVLPCPEQLNIPNSWEHRTYSNNSSEASEHIFRKRKHMRNNTSRMKVKELSIDNGKKHDLSHLNSSTSTTSHRSNQTTFTCTEQNENNKRFLLCKNFLHAKANKTQTGDLRRTEGKAFVNNIHSLHEIKIPSHKRKGSGENLFKFTVPISEDSMIKFIVPISEDTPDGDIGKNEDLSLHDKQYNTEKQSTSKSKSLVREHIKNPSPTYDTTSAHKFKKKGSNASKVAKHANSKTVFFKHLIGDDDHKKKNLTESHDATTTKGNHDIYTLESFAQDFTKRINSALDNATRVLVNVSASNTSKHALRSQLKQLKDLLQIVNIKRENQIKNASNSVILLTSKNFTLSEQNVREEDTKIADSSSKSKDSDDKTNKDDLLNSSKLKDTVSEKNMGVHVIDSEEKSIENITKSSGHGPHGTITLHDSNSVQGNNVNLDNFIKSTDASSKELINTKEHNSANKARLLTDNGPEELISLSDQNQSQLVNLTKLVDVLPHGYELSIVKKFKKDAPKGPHSGKHAFRSTGYGKMPTRRRKKFKKKIIHHHIINYKKQSSHYTPSAKYPEDDCDENDGGLKSALSASVDEDKGSIARIHAMQWEIYSLIDNSKEKAKKKCGIATTGSKNIGKGKKSIKSNRISSYNRNEFHKSENYYGEDKGTINDLLQTMDNHILQQNDNIGQLSNLHGSDNAEQNDNNEQFTHHHSSDNVEQNDNNEQQFSHHHSSDNAEQNDNNEQLSYHHAPADNANNDLSHLHRFPYGNNYYLGDIKKSDQDSKHDYGHMDIHYGHKVRFDYLMPPVSIMTPVSYGADFVANDKAAQRPLHGHVDGINSIKHRFQMSNRNTPAGNICGKELCKDKIPVPSSIQHNPHVHKSAASNNIMRYWGQLNAQYMLNDTGEATSTEEDSRESGTNHHFIRHQGVIADNTGRMGHHVKSLGHQSITKGLHKGVANNSLVNPYGDILLAGVGQENPMEVKSSYVTLPPIAQSFYDQSFYHDTGNSGVAGHKVNTFEKGYDVINRQPIRNHAMFAYKNNKNKLEGITADANNFVNFQSETNNANKGVLVNLGIKDGTKKNDLERNSFNHMKDNTNYMSYFPDHGPPNDNAGDDILRSHRQTPVYHFHKHHSESNNINPHHEDDNEGNKKNKGIVLYEAQNSGASKHYKYNKKYPPGDNARINHITEDTTIDTKFAKPEGSNFHSQMLDYNDRLSHTNRENNAEENNLQEVKDDDNEVNGAYKTQIIDMESSNPASRQLPNYQGSITGNGYQHPTYTDEISTMKGRIAKANPYQSLTSTLPPKNKYNFQHSIGATRSLVHPFGEVTQNINVVNPKTSSVHATTANQYNSKEQIGYTHSPHLVYDTLRHGDVQITHKKYFAHPSNLGQRGHENYMSNGGHVYDRSHSVNDYHPQIIRNRENSQITHHKFNRRGPPGIAIRQSMRQTEINRNKVVMEDVGPPAFISSELDGQHAGMLNLQETNIDDPVIPVKDITSSIVQLQ